MKLVRRPRRSGGYPGVQRPGRKCFLAMLGVTVSVLPLAAVPARDLTLRGKTTATAYLFAESPAYAEQSRNQWGLRVQPELIYGGDALLTWTLEPVLGYASQAQQQPDFDLRQAKLDVDWGDWRLTLGNDVVFWGVTEVVQLPDVVNQTDLADDIFGDTKLGQPMLRLERLSDLGAFQLYYFPLARVRRFPGEEGRLRLQPYVDEDAALWETDLKEAEPSFAARWETNWDRLDFGAFAYHGVTREPAFVPDADRLRPFYAVVDQLGIDAQWTQGATLAKLELLGTRDQPDRRLRRGDAVATAVGLEHNLFGIAGSRKDLALILEYSFDSRGRNALNPWQNDLTIGARLSFNDVDASRIRLLATQDLYFDTSSVRLTASRRWSENLRLSMDAVYFIEVDERDFLYSYRRDSFLRLTVERFF